MTVSEVTGVTEFEIL